LFEKNTGLRFLCQEKAKNLLFRKIYIYQRLMRKTLFDFYLLMKNAKE